MTAHARARARACQSVPVFTRLSGATMQDYGITPPPLPQLAADPEAPEDRPIRSRKAPPPKKQEKGRARQLDVRPHVIHCDKQWTR